MREAETPLSEAQRFHREYADTHASTVDGLRRQGWSREDAVEEADRREAVALANNRPLVSHMLP